MAPTVRAALLAACVGAASAQMRQTDALLTWVRGGARAGTRRGRGRCSSWARLRGAAACARPAARPDPPPPPPPPQYANGECASGVQTLVLVVQSTCQLVPAPLGAYVGYKVACAADGSGSTVQYCTDNTCSSCPVTQFIATDECIANDAAQFGSASLGVSCPARGTGDIELAAVNALLPGTVEVRVKGQRGRGQAGARAQRSPRCALTRPLRPAFRS